MFKFLYFNYLYILMTIKTTTIDAWMLSQIGLNDTYRITHLSMHYTRVFLCITVNNEKFPTFIEAQWPETYAPMSSMVYPYYEMHANGNHSDCSLIQQARWSQVDSLSRLWILDIGWKNASIACLPKLLVFDMTKNDVEVLRIDCSKFMVAKEDKILAVIFSPRTSHCHMERFIYFIMANEYYLLAYDILQQNWFRPKLVSKKFINVGHTLPVNPIDIAFGINNELIISDVDGSLYKANSSILSQFLLNKANSIDDGEQESSELKLEKIGSLLGPSKSMMIDRSGAIFYVVAKFGAVVRCEYKQNLTAESNEIIYLTSKNIQQIFFGFADSVWLLTDRLLKPQDNCFSGL